MISLKKKNTVIPTVCFSMLVIKIPNTKTEWSIYISREINTCSTIISRNTWVPILQICFHANQSTILKNQTHAKYPSTSFTWDTESTQAGMSEPKLPSRYSRYYTVKQICDGVIALKYILHRQWVVFGLIGNQYLNLETNYVQDFEDKKT